MLVIRPISDISKPGMGNSKPLGLRTCEWFRIAALVA